MLGEVLSAVRSRSPLIHCITNYVTAGDCANILLSCGASPIMARDPDEVEEITSVCAGLVLNLGTLDRQTVPAMKKAGRRANTLGHPVVLDPVGVGVSSLRMEAARSLLDEIRFAVIRGNSSEIRALAGVPAGSRGVDAADRVAEDTLDAAVALAGGFARRAGAVVAMTGTIDIVTDGAAAFCIRNGDPMMGKVTGVGCQLSALTAAFAAACPDKPLEAAAAAVTAMGICGELAKQRMGPLDGSGSYRTYLMDAVYHLTAEQLEAGARYEMR